MKDSSNLIDEKVNELEKGLNPDNTIIGTYKSPVYRLKKLKKNPRAGGNVDLINTGSFSKKIFLQSLGQGKFNFSSLDSKTTMLIKKYGSKWKGLNDNTFNEKQKQYVSKLNKQLRKEFKI